MWVNMKARFDIDGSQLHMTRIDFDTDGAKSVAVGDIDVSRWPEMLYDVKSRVNFPRMREIFFRNERWALAGDGDFTGKFHLFKGGHDLAGHFESDLLGVYDYRFPSTRGSLHWTRNLFEVTNGAADFYGGDRKGARSAAHIEDGLARLQARQLKRLLAKAPLPTKHRKPHREVIESGRVQDQPGRAARRITLHPICQTTLLATSTADETLRRRPNAPFPDIRMKMDIRSLSRLGSSGGGVKNSKRRSVRQRTRMRFCPSSPRTALSEPQPQKM